MCVLRIQNLQALCRNHLLYWPRVDFLASSRDEQYYFDEESRESDIRVADMKKLGKHN